MGTVPIRVLLVEDSPVALEILKKVLSSFPDIQVAGTAQDGLEALGLIPRLNPDVICTDLYMPRMDGLDFTREVMAKYPRPILVVSASVQEEDTQNVFRLLEAGAVDVYPKPRYWSDPENGFLIRDLIHRIKVLSGVVVFRRKQTQEVPPLKRERSSPEIPASIRVIALGASTGGPMAIKEILSPLPGDYPVPILCVQHIGKGFLAGLVAWLASCSKLKVKVAEPGEFPSPGTVYFPPEETHLEMDRQGKFISSLAAPVDGHRPSVSVTFRSVAESYGNAALGVLLTGMGSDGAEGMWEISQAGGTTIAQDEESCVVFGMPKQAIRLGAVQRILPLTEIIRILKEWGS